MSSRRFQDISSSYTVLVNKFLRCLQDVFTTFLRCTAKTVIYRKICLGNTSVIYGQCTNFVRVTTFFQVLVFHFTAPFSSCLQRRIQNLAEHLQVSFLCEDTGFKLLTILAKTAPSQMFNWVGNRLLAKGLKY